MRNKRFLKLFLIVFACVGMVAYQSCNTCNRQRFINDVTIDLSGTLIDSTYFSMAQKVIYALPTPVELSVLIKNSGVAWMPSLLNNPSDASNYLTNQKMALNLGAYLIDLTYAGLFSQTQTALRYKLAIQHLSEGLGLQAAFNINTLRSIEDNINDKDRLLQIISEAYAACMATFEESDRYFLTLTLLAGAWVESMYLATTSFDANLFQNEERIRLLVIDLILTFDMIWHVMSDFRNTPGIEELMNELSGLAYYLDRIGVEHDDNVVTVSTDTNVSEISSSNYVDVTPEAFNNIREQIHSLRFKFTSI